MPKGPKPVIERLLARVIVDEWTGCWEWLGAQNEEGYGIIGLGRRGEGVERTHRVTYQHYRGEIPDGLFVLHRCDNRQCCSPEHLFLGTALDNSLDMVAKGRFSTPSAKVTEDQVREIRESMLPSTAIAEKYNLKPRQIRRIRDRSRWKHVA